MTHASADGATAAVLVHVLMNDLGVIGSAARTLEARWEQLPAPTREGLFELIDSAVGAGLERLRVLLHESVALAIEEERADPEELLKSLEVRTDEPRHAMDTSIGSGRRDQPGPRIGAGSASRRDLHGAALCGTA